MLKLLSSCPFTIESFTGKKKRLPDINGKLSSCLFFLRCVYLKGRVTQREGEKGRYVYRLVHAHGWLHSSQWSLGKLGAWNSIQAAFMDSRTKYPWWFKLSKQDASSADGNLLCYNASLCSFEDIVFSSH